MLTSWAAMCLASLGEHEWILCTASKLDSIIFIIHLFKAAPTPATLKKKMIYLWLPRVLVVAQGILCCSAGSSLGH